jgi:hypothetical protein
MESTRKDLEGPPIYPKAYHHFQHYITVLNNYKKILLDTVTIIVPFSKLVPSSTYPSS